MFKMGCSMARRILGPGSTASGNQEQATATCFSASSSGQDQSSSKKSLAQKGSRGAKAAGGENNTGAANNKQSQPSSELDDFNKLEDDPRLPLNVRQIFKITKSWKAIARTMSKTGTAMFLNLFEQNQDLFYLFDRFQHLKGKDLHESMELREHAATVMATLDTSINSLSDYDNFVSYLHSIGQLHRKVPGFKREYFWKIEQPFMKAVKQTLDERCNETIEEIYKIAIKLIIETIADGYGHEPDPVGKTDGSSSARQGDAGQSGRSQDGGGGDNSGARNNNNDAGTDAAEFDGRGRPTGGNGGGPPSGRQNQQTAGCYDSATAAAALSDKPLILKSETAKEALHYSAASSAKRALSKIVVSTRARLQRAQRRSKRLARKFASNQAAAAAADESRRGAPPPPPAAPRAAGGVELILATCELMNTTEDLIDSCESYADTLADQPEAQRAARKLTSWRALLVNLNGALMNASGQPATTTTIMTTTPPRRRRQQQGQDAAGDAADLSCGQSTCCGEYQQSEATMTTSVRGDDLRAQDNLGQQPTGGTVIKMAQLCPMRHNGAPRTPDGGQGRADLATGGGDGGAGAAAVVAPAAADYSATPQPDASKENSSVIRGDVDDAAAGVARVTGDDDVQDDDGFGVSGGGGGVLGEQAAGSRRWSCAQVERIKHDRMTSDNDEAHNRVRSRCKQAGPSSRAINEGSSSRAIDSLNPRATYEGPSDVGVLVEVDDDDDDDDDYNSSRLAQDCSSLSDCSAPRRQTLSRSYLVGKKSGAAAVAAASVEGLAALSSGDNGNLYRVVPRESAARTARGYSEFNDLNGAQCPIKISASRPLERGPERDVTKSKCDPIWTLNTSADTSAANAAVAGQAPASTTTARTLASFAAGLHGDRSNDGRKCDHIGNNNLANAPDVIGTNQMSVSMSGAAESKTVALLQRGEKSVESLLQSIERRPAINSSEVNNENDNNNNNSDHDLIEFVKVIILINKLILALASSSIKTTTNTPTATNIRTTTLVN